MRCYSSVLILLTAAACAEPELTAEERVALDELDVDTLERSLGSVLAGKLLFERATYRGNGRTCETCHLPSSGSVSPADAQDLFDADPGDVLFRGPDSDQGKLSSSTPGLTYDRLQDHATFLIPMGLPDNVRVVGDSSATSVLLQRSAGSTLNTVGLVEPLLWDGRADADAQTRGAFDTHFESPLSPSDRVFDAIIDFETAAPRMYTSRALWLWANGWGPAPRLPAGRTAAEKRGRTWFVDGTAGACAWCHAGDTLDEVSDYNPWGLPAGERYVSAGISELNATGQPTWTLAFADLDDPDADPVVVTTPDPGRALVTGDVDDLNAFRIPTLWGAARTAPYFHDHSAEDLEDVVEHFRDLLAEPPASVVMSDRDVDDIVAYMALIR